jgi:hypothetical protein
MSKGVSLPHRQQTTGGAIYSQYVQHLNHKQPILFHKAFQQVIEHSSKARPGICFLETKEDKRNVIQVLIVQKFE